MKVYSPGDLAALLQVKPSTIRKYSLLFEKYNHKFNKNSQNQRFFTDSDVSLFRSVITAKHNTDMSLEDCVKSCLMVTMGTEITEPLSDTEPYTERYNAKEDIEELKQLLREQNEKIELLGKYIDTRLEERDQVLITTLREMQETKLLTAATKQPWWKRLFQNNN
jgi:DNA-binding transcriptional MerR regulator